MTWVDSSVFLGFWFLVSFRVACSPTRSLVLIDGVVGSGVVGLVFVSCFVLIHISPFPLLYICEKRLRCVCKVGKVVLVYRYLHLFLETKENGIERTARRSSMSYVLM